MNNVTVYDIVGKPGAQTFKPTKAQASDAPLLYGDTKPGITLGNYLAYIDRAIADMEAKGMTDRDESGTVHAMKRESYFASKSGRASADIPVVAAVHAHANPTATPFQSMMFAVGHQEGQQEAWAPHLSHYSDATLDRCAKRTTGEARYRAEMEIDRRRTTKVKPTPATSTTPASAWAASAPPPPPTPTTPEGEWAAMSAADRSRWASESVYVSYRRYEQRRAGTAPTAQATVTPPATKGSPEAEWAAMSAADRSAWVSEAVYCAYRRGEMRRAGVTPAASSPPPPTVKAPPAAGSPEEEWDDMTADQRSTWISKEVFVGFRRHEARRAARFT